MKLGDVIGIKLKPNEIDAVHRHPSKKSKAPPPFIIKFVSRLQRKEMFSKIIQSKITAHRMGGNEEINKTCQNHLSSRNQALFKYTRK